MWWDATGFPLVLCASRPFANLLFQKCPTPVTFLRFWCEIDLLLLQSRTPFADLIFQSAPAPSVSTIFMWNRALATVVCAFCRPLSPIRETAETETLLPRARTAILPSKSAGFRARKCFQAWTHVFAIDMIDWNDGVATMMWWPWRWDN